VNKICKTNVSIQNLKPGRNQTLKKILLVPLLVITLACNALLGAPTAMPTETPTATATRPPTATSSPEESTEVPTEVPTETQTPGPIGFADVRLHPYNGELPAQLADQTKKALAQGLMPVVEFDATW
jgi:hypothetical protein